MKTLNLVILQFVLFSVTLFAQSNEPLSHAEFIKNGTERIDGVFPVYVKEGNKVYLEIPEKLFNREIEIRAQVNKGFDLINRPVTSLGVVKLVKSINNSVCLQKGVFNERILKENSDLKKAFSNSNNQSIDQLLPIVAYTSNGDGAIIDISDYILNGMWSQVKYDNVKSLNSKYSKLADVHSFENGVSFRINQMYGYSIDRENTTGSMVFMPDGFMPLEMGIVISLLPDKDMRIRFAAGLDEFKTLSFWDYSQNEYGVMKDSILFKWRIPNTIKNSKEKKNNLSEIVFYIDSSCPADFISPIKEGVLAWNSLFKSIGMNKAINVIVADGNELLEQKNAVISYDLGPAGIRTTINNHPRTAEILWCRMNIGHGFLPALMKKYLIEHGAEDNRIINNTSNIEVAKMLLKQEVEKQVGVTLGFKMENGMPDKELLKSLLQYAYTSFPNSKSAYSDRNSLLKIAQRCKDLEKSSKSMETNLADYSKILDNISFTIKNIDKITKNSSSQGHEFVSMNMINSCISTYYDYLAKASTLLGDNYDNTTNKLLLDFYNKYLLYEVLPINDSYINDYQKIGIQEKMVSSYEKVFESLLSMLDYNNMDFFDRFNSNILSIHKSSNSVSNRELDILTAYVGALANKLSKAKNSNVNDSNYFALLNESEQVKKNLLELANNKDEGNKYLLYNMLYEKLK